MWFGRVRHFSHKQNPRRVGDFHQQGKIMSEAWFRLSLCTWPWRPWKRTRTERGRKKQDAPHETLGQGERAFGDRYNWEGPGCVLGPSKVIGRTAARALWGVGFWHQFQHVDFFPHTTKHFSDTSWVSCNAPKFWHYLLGDGIRSHRSRALILALLVLRLRLGAIEFTLQVSYLWITPATFQGLHLADGRS